MATQHPIELILVKQWASGMAQPMWITDAAGNLLFYNEPAESILGVRFDEAGEMPATELADRFVTTDLDGAPLPAEQLPLMDALTTWRPSHGALRMRSFDGEWRTIEVTAIPLIGGSGRRLGPLATFWQYER